LSSIQVREDFSNYRELFRCKYLFIYDKKQQNITAEEISSIDAINRTINLKYPVSFSFKKEDTVMFPLVICTLTTINPKFIKGKYGEVSLEFQEVYVQ